MSTDLQDELRRLADDVGPSAPPRDLWSRGVRRKRRRRGTALAVAAVVALILSATGVLSYDAALSRLQPAEPGQGRAAIPFRVETPSPWTPSTGSNPIGPLAVIGEAPHHHNWFSKPNDIFGVSAGDATYRFLSLPGLAADAGGAPRATLSPDGRHVGYWIEGDTPKRQPGFDGSPVVGFASYDTVTGSVTTRHVPTRRGVAPEAMLWVSPSELLVNYGHQTKQAGTSIGFRSYLWDPGARTIRKLPSQAGDYLNNPTRTPAGFSSAAGTDGLDVWTLGTLARRHYRVPVAVDEALMSPSGRSVAFKGGASGVNLYTGRLTAPGTVRVHGYGKANSGLFVMLAWIDQHHIVGPMLVGAHRVAAVVSVDVRTGARKTIGYGAQSYSDYASDLWSRPLAHRPGAPWEINPWWATFAVGSASCFAVLVFWNLRKRRDDTA